MKFSSGDIYEGEWVNDTPQGQGTMIYSSGNIYKGNWDGGFYHNFGTLTVGDTTYEGMFNYGLKEGKGIMTGPKGIYDGDWKANLVCILFSKRNLNVFYIYILTFRKKDLVNIQQKEEFILENG